MFVVNNFVTWVADVLHLAITIYIWIIIARAILSWVNPDPYNPIVRFLYRVTEPVLRPIRYRLPDLGGFDISPMVVILALYFIDGFVLPTVVRALYW